MEKLYGGVAAAFRRLNHLLQQALQQAFPTSKIHSIPLEISRRAGPGVLSSGLSFLCAKEAGLSPALAADRLSAFLPAQDPVFDRWERSGGYLNVHLSRSWYAACAAALNRDATCAWSATEEDFAFFRGCAPSPVAVQKTFVRLCSILRNCHTEGMLPLSCPDVDFSLLCAPQELDLIFCLCRLAEAEENSLRPILSETARAFDQFYNAWHIWSPDLRLTRARSALCLACGTGLRQGMEKTGWSPQKLP
ncbi:MAG: DALR anticodon-binding domain-containing protein [Oscillospiraceae bacterium]|nr:DALR anticodon-binding domain-containing protein [Oscillospiraceae bacterium]